MIENILEQKVLESYKEDIEVLLIDIFNDGLTKYKYEASGFKMVDKVSLNVYLENLKSEIKEEYLKNYMNSISIPKLEEKERNGEKKINIIYKTLNNDLYFGTSMLVNINDTKYVMLITKKEENKVSSSSNNLKYNTLVDSLSDVIFKIQNIFNVDEKNINNIKSVEEYINALFSSLTSNYPELKSSLNKTVANITGRSEDTILIVDDDLVMRNMIKKVFNDDYKIVTAANGKEAIEYLDENKNKGFTEASDHVIGIFLDLTMPVMDGFAVLDYLSKKDYLNRIPVIIISGDYEKETKQKVYNYNIADMLEKPFDFEVVRHRISNFINLYKSSNSLNNLINDQNNDLKEIIIPYVDAYFCDYENNINNVKKYMEILCNKIKEDYPHYNLDDYKINKIVDASKYYDIGFYSVPRSILNKDNNFTNDDLSKIKSYPLLSDRLVNYILNSNSDESYKKYAVNIAKYYHENYDGSGYPENLKEDYIPFEAQIASVCIMYNNLQRKGKEKARDIIISKSGVMFNPKIVGSFMKVLNEFEKVC